MGVEAFTVDGKVTIDTSPFESGIAKVTTDLSELSSSLKNVMNLGGSNWNFDGALTGLKRVTDDLTTVKSTIKSLMKEFESTPSFNFLENELKNLKEELNIVKQNIQQITQKTDADIQKVANTFAEVTTQIKESTSLASEFTSQLTTINSSIKPSIGQMSEMTKQIIRTKNGVQEINSYFDTMTGKIRNVSTFSKDISNYFMNENRWLQQNLALIEKEATATQRRANALRQVGKELIKQGNEVKRNLTFEEEMLATNNLIQNSIGKQIASRLELKGAIEEENALYMRNLEIEKASNLLEKEMVTFLNEENGLLQRITGSHEKSMTAIKEELSFEREKIGILSEENALINEQSALRQKNATTNSNVNKLDQTSNLPRRIGSMAVTMWGYNEIMDVYDKTMSHINAESQKNYFAKRMNMNSKETQNFTNQLNKMQEQYKKLDMTVVGANALETATKYKVQSQSLGDLTEVMAIYGSEFVKQGRTQEDSILAVNDALDGELRRLKEVGIGAEELKATGLWDGNETDKEGMLKALLQIAQERGYDKTAKDITNLSDAITTLEVKLSIDLARAFGVIEPLIRDVFSNFVTMLTTLESAISFVTPKIMGFARAIGLIDENGKATQFGNFLEKWASWFITLGVTAIGVYKIVKPLIGTLKNLRGATDTVAKTTGGIGGDVGRTMDAGGFKENFKSEWGKLGENLGKMARYFAEFAVGLAMAWALIEEGLILISVIGASYDALKPQFDNGVEFLKKFGWLFALLGGAMVVLSYALGRIPESAVESVGKGAIKLATGMAIAMGLVAEAIFLLNAPLLAIASIGAVSELAETQIQDGLNAIRIFGDALHYIGQDDAVAYFIIGLVAVSAILGVAPEAGGFLAIGIAASLLLVAEAIVLLNAPLLAIASLGYVAEQVDTAKVQEGAEAIKLIGESLKVVASAVHSLIDVDWSVFVQGLVDLGNKIVNGKTGLESLVQNVIPNMVGFAKDFNQLETAQIETEKVAEVTALADALPPLFKAVQNVNEKFGTSDIVGNIGKGINGKLSARMGMGLDGKLGQLYTDVEDIMDFAKKLSGLNGDGSAQASAIAQTASAIVQLKAKLDLLVTTISTSATKVHTASKTLGSAIKTGFKEGSSGFATSVVTVVASGIKEVQHRYDTWNNAGKTSAEKLANGFKKFGSKFKSTISTEMDYALGKLDDYNDDFYSKGLKLGKLLTKGFQDGADIHSPGLIARTTAQELRYTLDALSVGERLMYDGGARIGKALVKGYGNNGYLKTNVDILAKKGVTETQLQANARNVQLNTKKTQQTPKSLNPTINIDMSNSTVIGVQDLDAKIRQAVEKAIVSINSPDGAIGF